jgi:hypothetical protein
MYVKSMMKLTHPLKLLMIIIGKLLGESCSDGLAWAGGARGQRMGLWRGWATAESWQCCPAHFTPSHLHPPTGSKQTRVALMPRCRH